MYFQLMSINIFIPILVSCFLKLRFLTHVLEQVCTTTLFSVYSKPKTVVLK